MVIGLIDIFILIFLALGGLVGFKSGAIKELTRFIGFFLVSKSISPLFTKPNENYLQKLLKF